MVCQAVAGSRLQILESRMFCIANWGGCGLAGFRGVRLGAGDHLVAYGGFVKTGGGGGSAPL